MSHQGLVKICLCPTNASCLNASTLIEKLRNFHLSSFWEKIVAEKSVPFVLSKSFSQSVVQLVFFWLKKLFNYEIKLPTRQVFLLRYVECMTAPITSAIINCPIYIKTHKLWKLSEKSISIFCHVNTCHEKDLSFKTQIYEEIKSTSHILAIFCDA